MACANVLESLRLATESLAKDVYRKASHRSIWLDAMPKGTYPVGTGVTQTTFKIESSEPAVNDDGSGVGAWEEVAAGLFDDNQQLCSKTFVDAEWGMTESTFNVERQMLQGPVVCSDSWVFQHQPDRFLRGYVEEIGKHAKRVLEDKLQNTYMKLANKVTVDGNAATSSTLAPSITIDSTNDRLTNVALTESGAAANSTGQLEQDHLDLLAVRLIEDGATEGDSNGYITFGETGPLFPLIIGMEASNKIAKESNSGGLRDDLRYGDPADLLKRIGATRVLGNFRHIISTLPPRFTYDSGKYVRVNAYGTPDAASKGKKSVLQAGYRNATHEAAIVLNPAVFKALIVRPKMSAGGLSTGIQNWVGDWKFVVGGNKISSDCVDPLESMGRHYAQYVMAFEPVFPEHGAVILHKR